MFVSPSTKGAPRSASVGSGIFADRGSFASGYEDNEAGAGVSLIDKSSIKVRPRARPPTRTATPRATAPMRCANDLWPLPSNEGDQLKSGSVCVRSILPYQREIAKSAVYDPVPLGPLDRPEQMR